MFFVILGLVILLVTFLVAVVSLFREFGQRTEDRELSYDDYRGLDFAEEVVPAEEVPQQIETAAQMQDLPLSEEEAIGDSVSSLDEVVPFPWEVEGNFPQSSQVESSDEAGEGDFSDESFRIGRDGLYNEFSLQDLKQKS